MTQERNINWVREEGTIWEFYRGDYDIKSDLYITRILIDELLEENKIYRFERKFADGNVRVNNYIVLKKINKKRYIIVEVVNGKLLTMENYGGIRYRQGLAKRKNSIEDYEKEFNISFDNIIKHSNDPISKTITWETCKKQIYMFIGPKYSGRSTMIKVLKEIDQEIVEFIPPVKHISYIEEIKHPGAYCYKLPNYVDPKSSLYEKIKLREQLVSQKDVYYQTTQKAIHNLLEKNNKCAIATTFAEANDIYRMFSYEDVHFNLIYLKTSPSNMFLRLKNRGENEQSILKFIDSLINDPEFHIKDYDKKILDNNGTIEESKEQLKQILNIS